MADVLDGLISICIFLYHVRWRVKLGAGENCRGKATDRRPLLIPSIVCVALFQPLESHVWEIGGDRESGTAAQLVVQNRETDLGRCFMGMGWDGMH